jgi:hypothetical protein
MKAIFLPNPRATGASTKSAAALYGFRRNRSSNIERRPLPRGAAAATGADYVCMRS